MQRALLTLVPLALLALTGCPPADAGDTGSRGGGACDEMAYTSIALTVEPVDGLDLAQVVATYNSGGDDVDCESFEAGEFACGWEESGPIALHVEAPGFIPHDETVVIEADECHVITADVSVTLEPDTDAQ